MWRDLVLMRNKKFRRDNLMQEASADYELRYMLLYNKLEGKKLKKELGEMAAVLPLVPKFTPDTFNPPVFAGPLDRLDDEGLPLIEERHMDLAIDRMRLPKRQKPLPASASPTVKPKPPRQR